MVIIIIVIIIYLYSNRKKAVMCNGYNEIFFTDNSDIIPLIMLIKRITSFSNCVAVRFFTGTFASLLVSSILMRYFGAQPQSGHCDRFFNQLLIQLKQNLCSQLSGFPSGYFNRSKQTVQFDSIFRIPSI